MDQRAVYREVSESATNELQLQHIPVRGVPTIYRDYDGRFGNKAGSFPAGSLITNGSDYWASYDIVDSQGNGVCQDGIIRAMGLWPTQAGSLKVVYTAGYSDNELRGGDPLLDASPIWDATLSEATRRARRILLEQKGSLGLGIGLLNSESLGGYSYSANPQATAFLMSADIAPENKIRLQPFANLGISLGG